VNSASTTSYKALIIPFLPASLRTAIAPLMSALTLCSSGKHSLSSVEISFFKSPSIIPIIIDFELIKATEDVYYWFNSNVLSLLLLLLLLLLLSLKTVAGC